MESTLSMKEPMKEPMKEIIDEKPTILEMTAPPPPMAPPPPIKIDPRKAPLKGEDMDMFGDLLKKFTPKDLKGLLKLLDGFVPGVKKLEPEIKSVAKAALPLLKKIPGDLEEKTPTIREYTKAVWNSEEISDEQRLKWAKETENDEGVRKALQVVHDNAAAIKTLLKMRKDVEKKALDFVTPIIDKEYSALIPI